MKCHEVFLLLLLCSCWNSKVTHGASIMGCDQSHHMPVPQEYYYHENPNQQQEHDVLTTTKKPLDLSSSSFSTEKKNGK